MTFLKDYTRGMDTLYDYAPYFYKISRALGVPYPNENIDTAQVSFDAKNTQVLFEMNPTFVKNLSDEQVAFAIAHETYHVLLEHLPDLLNIVDYPIRKNLINAQEAIINDTIKATFALDAPDNLIWGEQFGADFSIFSTKEGYDYLSQKEESSQSSDDGENDESSDNKDSHGGSGKGNDGSGQDENSAPACGGINVSDEDLDAFRNAFVDGMIDAINDIEKDKMTKIPDDMMNVIEDFCHENDLDAPNAFGIGNNSGSVFANFSDDMNLDWKRLLSVVNPKIMSSGKPKYKDSWHVPRRKMISSYPNVVLPVSRKIDSRDGKGDEKPTFVLALDMSVSIPTYLIDGLANLALSIPQDLIKGIPVTWSDHVLEFDSHDKKIVSRGGTNIQRLYNYTQEIAIKEKQQPYVMVITDGVCSFNNVDRDIVKKYWFWGAINKDSIYTITSNFNIYLSDSDSALFNVNNFLVK